MKKFLLPETGTFYKANLHCHSTFSDGRLTPEELKALYKANGYSVLAYTDHEVMLPHKELADESFLPLTGFEISFGEQNARPGYGRVCHLCLIALEPENETQICWHRSKYSFRKPEIAAMVQFDEKEPDFERYYTPECINEVIRRAHEAGFFVTYNHPKWSLERYPQYSQYEGMDAMEIVNYASLVEGYDDRNGHVYDDLLAQGKRIYAVAADDNHDGASPDSLRFDSCGGYIQIKAEKLEYRTITKALQDGSFYASEKPEIHALWAEDGKIHIETSPAYMISYFGSSRYGRIAENGGQPVTEGVFDIGEHDDWFRIEVRDDHGFVAYTNAYETAGLK